MIPVRNSVHHLRGFVYWLGLRPKPGSILFSPTLSILYGFRDAWVRNKSSIEKAYQRGYEDVMVLMDEIEQNKKETN